MGEKHTASRLVIACHCQLHVQIHPSTSPHTSTSFTVAVPGVHGGIDRPGGERPLRTERVLVLTYGWCKKSGEPVDMVNIPLFTGFQTYQVVQDIFHQQYVCISHYMIIEYQRPKGLNHQLFWLVSSPSQTNCTQTRAQNVLVKDFDLTQPKDTQNKAKCEL